MSAAIERFPHTPAGLKRWRRSLLLSQRQLAELCGKEAQTISRWERGQYLIDPMIWSVLALKELDMTGESATP